MGILDTLFPSRQTRRAIERHEAKRSFDGATGGRRAPRAMAGPLNSHVAASADSLAARARYLRANNPQIANGVQNLVAALVGTGLRPNPRGTDAPGVTAAFETWADDASADGSADLYGLQRVVAEHVIVDGEALAILHRDPDGLRVQLLPPEHLDRSKGLDWADGSRIVQGVEMDARGRPVAYWIHPHDPATVFGGQASVRFDAGDVIHVFQATSAGQVRGVSWLAPAILPASELDQLMDALLVGVKVGAMLSAYIVNQNDLSGGEPFDADTLDSLSLEPGQLHKLPAGYDIRFLTPDAASDGVEFVRQHLQALAAAIGVPEHLLSGDMSRANYSSLRAALVPFRQRLEAIQYGSLVPRMLNPIWRAWAEVEGGLAADIRVDWIAPAQPWVDPKADILAVEKELELGLTSRKAAIHARGWRVEDLDAEIAADAARAARLTAKPGDADAP